MKKILFTSTALAAMAFGGVASAQGISLFGDARLGLGYNIFNNGDLRLETNDDGDIDTPDDLRAISRVRFGVNMTGVSDAGITFGATIRADNAGGGQGGSNGQTAGNVFVSGEWGTLTFGDTDGADEFFVGDVNEIGLTGLGFYNETPFISNGGNFGRDDGFDQISDPAARPTVRYNIDIAGFGLALSSNRDLNDIGVGLGYNGEFGASTFSIGLGYYDFQDFDNVTPNGIANVPGGKQWSASVGGSFSDGLFDAKLIWTSIEFDGGAEVDWAAIGVGTDFAEFRVDAYYAQIIDATGAPFANDWDGLSAYGLGMTYDLGGGLRVEGGVASVYNLSRDPGVSDDGYVVADFGLGMRF